MMIFFRSFIFLLLFSCLFNFAALSEQIDIKKYTNIQHGKLKNGLDIYVMSDHRIPFVFHGVIYKVGGMDDPVGKAGLAHYFEHLMFETAGKFQDIKSTMAEIGAQINAYTTSDYTCYYEMAHKKDLPLMMEVEADRMGSFDVTQDKIDREKNIVLEERKMRTDNEPISLLFEEIHNAFYRTGYGKPVVGWKTDINSFNKNDIEKFHDNYYHPGNAMLIIVGDVEFDEVLKLAEEKYGSIEAKPVIRYYPNPEPVHNASMELTVKSPQVADPTLWIRYKVPMVKHTSEIFPIDLAVKMLGGGKSSKLHQDLVLDKNVAVSVFAYYSGLTFSDGFIDIIVIPRNGIALNVVEKELEKSISNFIHTGVTVEDLENEKYKYKAEQLDCFSSLDSIAFFYSQRLALNLPVEEIDISYDKVKDVKLDEINAKIYTIFSANKLIGRLLPEGDIRNENK